MKKRLNPINSQRNNKVNTELDTITIPMQDEVGSETNTEVEEVRSDILDTELPIEENVEYTVERIKLEPSDSSGVGVLPDQNLATGVSTNTTENVLSSNLVSLGTLGGIGLLGSILTFRASHSKTTSETKTSTSEVTKSTEEIIQTTPTEVPKVLPQPEFIFDPITDDNIINRTELNENITLSGSVTNANTNDVVTLKVGNTTLTATVQADGRFSVNTTGAVLAQSNQIEAAITTRDSAGNQATATKTHSYDVITNIAQPVITLDKVTQDNVINATEAKQSSITLSGSVTNANANDVVTLKVGNTTLTATVQADGRFSVNTTGAVLAQGNQIEAAITTRDSAGNQVTATQTHSYDVITNIAQPVITLDKVTQDNVINATEAKQSSITLSGSVTNANANDVVTLKVGNSTLTATVQADGRFSTTTTGAVLAQGNQIEASTTTRDSAGNQVTATKTHSYDVVTNIAQPVITLDKVTQDNVINATEAKQSSITLSGSVTNANANDVVTLKVGNTTLTATVQADGRFSVNTTGAVLAQGNQIEASITTRDSAGNQATATKTHSYDVITNIAQPVITLDKVTQDNVINATEAKQSSITLSGSVTNANANDVVTLKVGSTTLTATVQADGRFSVNTTGAVLAQSNQIEATITTRDSAGNQATATKTHSYDVITNIAQPVITLDKVTQDNVINATEAKQSSITLSGSVTNANTNDVVTLKVGNTTLTATVQADGRFSVNTTGAVLAQGNQIEASITTRDSVGNQATATKTHTYDVITNILQPVITLDKVTQDNVINATEAKQASITLSGSVTNANANDIVTLKVGNTTLTATVQADGRFSVNTTGAVLAQGNQIEASITTRDSAGNQATATKTHSYDVITNIAQPVITLDKVTQDNVINATEAKQSSITLSGSVTNANTNDVVTLKVGNTTLTATVQADGRFSTTTSGAVLAQGNHIEASITTRDSAGNQATATKTHSYSVVTYIAKPVITLDKVTQDNVINATEAKQSSITLSGSVTNANTNDVVTLKVGNTTLTATVQADGRFSTTTTGAVLAQSNQIEATITTRDSVGNQATATKTHSYDVITNLAQPVITLDKVTQDNVINATEAKQSSITLSGSVTNANTNDVVTLKVGNTTLTATVQADGRFSVNTTGAVLAQSNQIEATITTRDSVDNQVTATKTHSYSVVTYIAKPVITFDDVTDHNSINLAETKLSQIIISGTVKNARDKDTITIKIGDQTLTTEVVGERFSVTTSGQILAKNSKITASLTTRDTAGNEATANASHDYTVLPIYSTKVTYPNNVQTYESNDPFDFSTLKYTLDNPQDFVLQNSVAKSKVIAALEQYVQANPTLAAQNIIDSYKADSDGDGIIDIYDKDPQMWNVSERDLRFFATAAHSSENVNKNIFERYREDAINSFNEQRMSNGADIREINKQWEVLKYVSTGEDLQYFIYGNGKNEDGSYQNVVIAFRGSNSKSDWQGNLKLLSGEKHPQLDYIDQAAEYISAYNPGNLYATGNSLGGYLAQYFASYTIQNNPQLSAVFRHSSLFNPAVLKTGSGSPTDLKEARVKADEFVRETMIDDSDLTNSVSLYKTDSYVIRGEFVSSGYSILGIKVGALGSYENTTFFEGTGDEVEKHKMNQFYANNQQLDAVFSRGYRMDNHYLNRDSDNDGLTDQQEARLGTERNKVDSDGDGFSDKLEAQLKSDPLNGNTIPEFLDKINIQEVFSAIAVTIESQNSQGGAKSKELQLTASLEGDSIVYSLDPIVAAEHTADFVL